MPLLSFLWSLLPLMINYGETFEYFFRESFFTLSREKFFTGSKANRTNLGILNIQALNLALHIFPLKIGGMHLFIGPGCGGWRNQLCLETGIKFQIVWLLVHSFFSFRTGLDVKDCGRKDSWILFWTSVTMIVHIFKKHTKEFMSIFWRKSCERKGSWNFCKKVGKRN